MTATTTSRLPKKEILDPCRSIKYGLFNRIPVQIYDQHRIRGDGHFKLLRSADAKFFASNQREGIFDGVGSAEQ